MMEDNVMNESAGSVTDDDAVRSILEENARRNAENSRLFDPVSGEGSVGSRFLFDVRGLSRSWLPDTMRGERMIGSLAASGDVDLYLRKELGRTPTQRDRERLASRLDRLRMLHDFPYWAATRAYIKDKRGGDDVLFRLNRPQRKFVERLERMRVEGRPIRLILLKARQWGGRTYHHLLMYLDIID